MVGLFSYSFDRDTYHGNFATRAAALAAGIQQLADESLHGETIFVGKRVPFGLGLDELAETAVRQMQQHLRAESADAAEPLLHVNEHQLADLDERLRRAVNDWLAADGLTPLGSKMTAISEHATQSSAIDALK